MRLSIVIPFYNERDTIEPILKKVSGFVGRYNFELICVNDASRDGSGEVFSKLLGGREYQFARCVDIKPEEHVGYGHAIMQGVQTARGDVIAWTHSDLQTDPADVFRAFDEFLKYNDTHVMIKGARIKRSPKDVLFSFGMACVASLALGRLFFEINAQPKLFSRIFLEHLKDAPGDFSLDLFALYRAKKYNFAIKSIDVMFERRRYGQSSWAYSLSSKIKTIIRTVRYIFKLRRSL